MSVGLSRALVLAIHDEQLARHGGAPGLRDSAQLDSLVARTPGETAAGEPDIVGFAAGCALAIARARPFLDGNRRTGFAAMVTLLALNDIGFDPPEVDATLTVLGIVPGGLQDNAFLAWVRSHARRRDSRTSPGAGLHPPGPQSRP